MPRNLTKDDVVTFVILPLTGRTYEVTEVAGIRDNDPDPLVRVWPTDPDYTRGGQWVSQSLLTLATECPQHCPRCGVDLKAEGYPVGHRTDEGVDCEWSWDRQQAILDDLATVGELATVLDQAASRPCSGGCGLAAADGDVFCPGCRDGHERDRTYSDPDRLAGY